LLGAALSLERGTHGRIDRASGGKVRSGRAEGRFDLMI
jgi:hypothetical protein